MSAAQAERRYLGYEVEGGLRVLVTGEKSSRRGHFEPYGQRHFRVVYLDQTKTRQNQIHSPAEARQMKIEQLLKEAALERPGVGMPESVVQMTKAGWVPALDEYLDQDDMAWSIWFLLLYRFLESKDHLSSR